MAEPDAATAPTSRGIVAAVRRELAAARHAARASLAATGAARVAALAQLDAVRRSAPIRRDELLVTRDTALAEARARRERETAKLGRGLLGLAEAAAPGTAGSPWTAWRPGMKPEQQAGLTPGLLRIGALVQEPAPPTAVPALVPLLDTAHLYVSGDGTAAADALIGALLLRALASVPPGSLRISVYDPGRLGGALAGLAPLAPAGLISYLGPGGLAPLLDDLAEQIRRINENVLGGVYLSVAELAAETGRRPEPWRVAVLLADPNGAELSKAERAQLDRVTRTGVAAGVHLISRGFDLATDADVETIALRAGGTARTSLTGEIPVRLDAPPGAALVTGVCRALAEQATAGPPPVPFAALLPDEIWQQSSAESLRAPIGEGTDGRLVELVLGDDPPHALIGGPSGSGKTNLIYCWLGALATRYSPTELSLYLLDFKEGVSFARFAPGTRDPSWLPQVRLVGVNVNSDREFGLALLRHLAEELKRRAAAAKQHEATKLAELRAEDPQGAWPRIVAVIDEFQVLLGARDAVTSEAVDLLEDLARRGRSQGIHLVLASQDVSGIEALWGRSGLVSQFTLRVALPKARRILSDVNLAAELIPRCHAVVNADSGVPSANTVVRLPDAGDRATWLGLQEQLWSARPDGAEPPRLFDGDSRPLFPLLPPPPAPELPAAVGAVALLGETIDVAGRPATLRLNRAPGRNLAVLGTRADEACAVLLAAGHALGSQHTPGSARFSVLCLDSDATTPAKSLHAVLDARHRCGWYDADGVTGLLAELARDTGEQPGGQAAVPHYVFGFALDAVATRLAARPGPGLPSGHELLRTVLSRGPERRTHLLCWWRTVARLRDDLGGPGARFDAIGAWVALDVHGPELSALYPQPGGPAWFPRLNRALHFDRSVHHRAQIIIPYEVAP
ncbi:FtsK/SpoIIIE domain-containing protein [Catellatospora coxensis]|uniref:Cell division protein FtsK n=1 Tax=Catellatospora coxensis TaxID=310354 RepID=A0A8J3KZD1_9ACTN|nr:FtsK/SpoIIIE domain-containing protein [Catellatospora coxensis]GIG09635.1 cell division protein FtsK [Catellatospora coxensis]